MTLATMITCLRFVLAPFFCLLVYYNRYGVAFVVLALSGFSDFIDGYLARKTGQVSELGAILDPLADKFLMLLAFTTLSLKGYIPWTVSGIIIMRDVLIVGGVAFLRTNHIPIRYKPLVVSKITTFVQIVALLLAFGNMYERERPPGFLLRGDSALEIAGHSFTVLAVILTLLSGVYYAVLGRRYWHQHFSGSV